jgi:hypothetical protein
MMVLSLAAMTFWNVAGYFDDSTREGNRSDVWLYGWPSTYLIRGVYREPSFLARRAWMAWEWEPKWNDGFIWARAGETEEFDSGQLILNICVALTITAVTSGAFEVWRRRRRRLLQFHLSDLCLVVFFVACVLAFGRHATTATAALERIEKWNGAQLVAANWKRATPQFIHALLPGEWRKPGDYAVEIRFSNEILTPSHIDVICAQTRLESLELLEVKIQPVDGWARIAACAQIREVSLGGKHLQGDPLSLLAHYSTIRKLQLSLQELSDRDLRSIGQITSLRELVISDDGQCQWTNLAPLAELPHLTSLEVDLGSDCSSPRPECDLSALAGCQKLRRLVIGDKVLTHRDVHGLTQLGELEELSFDCCQLEVSEDGTQLIAAHPRLTMLNLGINRPVPQSMWPAIADLRHLEELHVEWADAGDSEMKWIRGIRTLRTLTCGSKQLSNDGIAHLVDLPHLEHLRIDSRKLNDGVIDILIAMRALRFLDLSCCDTLTPAGLARLKKERPDVTVDLRMCY